MALAGTGAIIIWNDITAEGRAEFYDWHLHEHIPERVSVPGFLRGSRYIALTAQTKPEFLTLYETVDAAAATSGPYLARLNAPTEWTKRATAQFRNTSRALTTVVRSEGQGQGGVMGTIRIDGSDQGRAALGRISAAQQTLQDIARMARITGAHLCMTLHSASAAKTAESRDRVDILAAPIGAVLIEGCDVAAVRTAVSRLVEEGALDGAHLPVGFYAIEHARSASPI